MTDKMTLPDIYIKLARDQRIVPQQYDDFYAEWRRSEEYRCILLNCAHYQNSSAVEGRLLLPASNFNFLVPSFADWRSEYRSDALADAIGELIWLFICRLGALPVLEIATPIASIIDNKEKLNYLAQPWCSLYLPTFGMYYLPATVAEMTVTPDWTAAKLIGWMDELYVAGYENEENSFNKDVPEWFGDWPAYAPLDHKWALPNYFKHYDYLTTHRAELVAGYERSEKNWRLSVLNGISHNEKNSAFKKLFGTSGFGEVAHLNVSTFQSHFLHKKFDADNLNSNTAEASEHKEIRKSHQSQLEVDPADRAFTLTFSVVPELTEKRSGGDPYDLASCFVSCLITQVGAKLIWTEGKNSLDKRKTFKNAIEELWDSLEMLKYPVTRQMVAVAAKELRERNAKLVGTAIIFNSIEGAFREVVDKLAETQNKVSELHAVLRAPFSGLYLRADRVQQFFKAGKIQVGGEELEINHRGEPKDPSKREILVCAVVHAFCGEKFNTKDSAVMVTLGQVSKKLTNAEDPCAAINESLHGIIEKNLLSRKLRSLSHKCDADRGSELQKLLTDLKYVFHRAFKPPVATEKIPAGLLLMALPKLTLDLKGWIDEDTEWGEWEGAVGKCLPLALENFPFTRISEFVEAVCRLVCLNDGAPDGTDTTIVRLSCRSFSLKRNQKRFLDWNKLGENQERVVLLTSDWLLWLRMQSKSTHGEFFGALHYILERGRHFDGLQLNVELEKCRKELVFKWVKQATKKADDDEVFSIRIGEYAVTFTGKS